MLILGILQVNAQQFFQENKGQWNSEFDFFYERDGGLVYLKKNSISYVQYDAETWADWVEHDHSHKERERTHKNLKFHHFELSFPGSDPDPKKEGLFASDYDLNYFIGNDKSKWASGVKDFQKVKYENLYPQIDLVAQPLDHGFKYDFILKKGADLNNIRLQYNHLEKVTVSEGEIRLKTSLGIIKERIPECTLIYNNVSRKINAEFITREDGSIGIRTDDNIEQFDSLIIDPEVVFVSYAGNTADNFGFTATYDSFGYFYLGGICTGPYMDFNVNGRYPATFGAFDVEYNGGSSSTFGDYGFACDITISKYTPDGRNLIYATYIGGQNNEYPHSIVCDSSSNLIIFGTSFSGDYPTTADAFQRDRKGVQDIIVTKLDQKGASLIGSTFLGGSSRDGLNEARDLKYFYADNHRGEVIANAFGEIFVATNSLSNDFPLVDAFQSTNNGRQEGIFFMMNEDLSQLLWSSYYGGSSDDAFYSVDINSEGLIYLSGGTKSNDLSNTAGTIGENYHGGLADGFITCLDPKTREVLRTTYFGTNEYEQIFSLDIDNYDQIYFVGHSVGDIPIVGNVFNEPKSGQFITKVDPELKNIEFSTVFGSGDGAPDITINAFLVDECRKIFVSGWGGETSNKSFSSTDNLEVTPDAYQKTTDGSDFYLLVLSKNAKERVYATFFGGTSTADHVDGGTSRFDKKGFIYQSICGSCPDNYPMRKSISDIKTTPDAFSPRNKSPRCSNTAFKLEFGNLNRKPRLADQIYTVRAYDTLKFNYNIYDPDEDSLFVTLSPEQKLEENIIDFRRFYKGYGELSIALAVTPDCDDVGDTLELGVYTIDQGCPEVLDSGAVVRIVVEPPPTIEPPETICLVFTSESSVRLTWDAIPKHPVFQEISLYRVDPSGNTEKIYTTTSYGNGSFEDFGLNSPKSSNYTYFLRVLNICGEEGSQSIKVSTTKEFESPIDGTYIVTATVTDDDKISITWLKSTEEDFGTYTLYRKENSQKLQFEYYATIESINDTVFIDKSVNVNKKSYCYTIAVNDNCGHVSAQSNKGCTILLEGESKPFKHDLYWNAYSVWNGGVDHYDLDRSVDTGSLRYIATTQATDRFYIDSVLDYCWGGYWYRVRATEAPGSLDAISQSNKIYLIQPPLLHVPNAFTPNGDGLNEKWGIVPVFVKEYHVQVYDRWGGKVYDSENVKTDWDGFYSDVQEPNSVYIYRIRFTGWDRSVHYRRGTVTIIK